MDPYFIDFIQYIQLDCIPIRILFKFILTKVLE